MKPTSFDRYRAHFGDKAISYGTLRREYQCNECGGRLVEKWADGQWLVECGRCGVRDFVHDHQAARDRHEVYEVLDGLPQELVEQLN